MFTGNTCKTRLTMTFRIPGLFLFLAKYDLNENSMALVVLCFFLPNDCRSLPASQARYQSKWQKPKPWQLPLKMRQAANMPQHGANNTWHKRMQYAKKTGHKAQDRVICNVRTLDNFCTLSGLILHSILLLKGCCIAAEQVFVHLFLHQLVIEQ